MAEDFFVDVGGSTKKIRDQLNEAAKSMDNLGRNTKSASGNFGKATSEVKKFNNTLKNINVDGTRSTKTINNLSSAFSRLSSVINIAALYKLAQVLATSINSAMDMVESINLFNVAMGESAESAGKFADEMAGLYGLDPTNLKNSIGTFGLLARSMGMASDQSEVLSVNTAKLAIDLASLTNVPIQQVMRDLRSGLIGQTETVYKYGLDLTEASLKQEALRLGIEKSVRNMSQGEKMALRYSVMIRQSALAQGDFAKTIETPSNQLKILSERLITLTRTIGTLFIPMLTQVLPYVNAFVEALTIIIGGFASALGYVAPKVENISNGFSGMGDAALDAAKKVKKLHNAAIGLDELNVIAKPDAAKDGIGGIGDVMAGIKFAEYDNMMRTIQDRSKSIRDNILETLGFTKQIDKEGKITWTWSYEDFKEGMSKLGEEMAAHWKKMNLGEKLVTILLGAIGLSLVARGFKALISPITWLLKPIIGLVQSVAKGIGNIKLPPNIFDSLLTLIDKVKTGLSELGSKIGTAGGIIIGSILVVIAAIVHLWQTNEDFKNDVISTWEEIKAYFAELGTVLLEPLQPIVQFFSTTLPLVFSTLVSKIKSDFNDLGAFLGILWDGLSEMIGYHVVRIMKILRDLLDFLIGVFTLDWARAWGAVKQTFIDIVNSVVGATESMVNMIIKGINFMIDQLNKIKLKPPKWAEKKFGIGSIGFDIPNLGTVSLPRLARGGTLDSGQAFIAGEMGRMEAVGSYQGKTTVLPLENTDFVDAIYNAVTSAMTDSQQSGGNVIENVLTVDGDVLYRSVERAKTRSGYAISTGGKLL